MNTIAQKLREVADLVEQLPAQQQEQVKHVPQPLFDFGLYFNSRQPVALYEDVICRVNDCLKVAEKYRGEVFGGYVRNVVVPRLFGDNKVIGYKDVDVWFKTEGEANSFVTDMGHRMVKLREGGKVISREEVYPFSRTQYLLLGPSLKSSVSDNGVSDGIIFDVIVSETIPVNDLNVNQLTYSPHNGLKSHGKETTFELTSAIVRKQASMLEEYPIATMPREAARFQHKRLIKLIDGGWEIKDQKGQKYKPQYY